MDERWLIANGEPASAQVISRQPVGNETLVALAIQRAGQAPYQAAVRCAIPMGRDHEIVPGALVAVRINPSNPHEVAVDLHVPIQSQGGAWIPNQSPMVGMAPMAGFAGAPLPSANPDLRSVRRISLIACLPGLIVPVVLGFVFLFSGMMLKSCAPEPYDAALLRANQCSEVTERLGTGIEGTIGVGCGSLEVGGGTGVVDWSVPVEGSLNSGTLMLNATAIGNVWTLHRVDVEVDGVTINALTCPSLP